MSTDRPSAKQPLSNTLLNPRRAELALIKLCSQRETRGEVECGWCLPFANITAPFDEPETLCLDKDIIPWATAEFKPL